MGITTGSTTVDSHEYETRTATAPVGNYLQPSTLPLDVYIRKGEIPGTRTVAFALPLEFPQHQFRHWVFDGDQVVSLVARRKDSPFDVPGPELAMDDWMAPSVSDIVGPYFVVRSTMLATLKALQDDLVGYFSGKNYQVIFH